MGRVGLRCSRRQCQAQKFVEPTEHLARLRALVLVGLPCLLLGFEEIPDGGQRITDLLLLPPKGFCFVGGWVPSGSGSAWQTQQREKIFVPTSTAGESPRLDQFRRDPLADPPVESLSVGLHRIDFQDVARLRAESPAPLAPVTVKG